jgi:hypothetical protein
VVRVLSAGKLSSCREGAQTYLCSPSDVQTYLLADDEVPKQGLSQKMCCLCSLHAHLHRLVSEGHGTQDGSLTCSGGQSPPGQIPLLWWGRCPDIWSPKWGLSRKLCSFCLSQKLCPKFYFLGNVFSRRLLLYACWFIYLVLMNVRSRALNMTNKTCATEHYTTSS